MTASPPSTEPTPAADGERVVSLDFIRGIAVMGIVWANLIAFGQPFLAYSWPGGFATPPQSSDGMLWAAQLVLIDGKMRGLFTLLFGAGLALFAERSQRSGKGPWLQMRRLAWLFLFGLAHFYLLWRGDILTVYAVCGLVSLAAMHWPPVVQLASGLAAYCAGALWNTLVYGLFWRSGADLAGPPSERADAAREIAITQSGRYLDYLAHGAIEHRWNWWDGIVGTAPETIPLILLGAALYRFGLFDRGVSARTAKRWGWAGVGIGSAVTLALALWALKGGLSYPKALFVTQGPQALARLPVILGLAALLALWVRTPGGAPRDRVVATGRMAFSNYVGTSLVLLFVFQPPGLRLFGELERVQLYLVALAVCAVMLAWSRPWLAHFRYGPLEWLWRCLTYGKVFALRR